MLDNIRDRGTKKWTAMMLSEHLVELEKMEELLAAQHIIKGGIHGVVLSLGYIQIKCIGAK